MMRRMNNPFGVWGWTRRINAFLILTLIVILNVDLTSSTNSRTVEKVGVSYKHSLPWKHKSEVTKFIPSEALKPSKECGKSNSKLSSKCHKDKMRKEKFIKLEKKLSEKFEKELVKKSLPPDIPQSLLHIEKLTPDVILDINKFIRKKRHYCKLREFEGWSCQKLRLSTWLAKQMEKNTTMINPWVEIVTRKDNDTEVKNSETKDLKEIQPETWPETVAYRLIKKLGDPEDLFVFYKYKDFINTRELKVTLPYKTELKITPRKSEIEGSARSKTYHLSSETPRIFWDPGFNLKLKLPFFRDELKIAVSTGPSFVFGIGVGIVLLIIKSMFAPFLLGMKWMMYNVFFKDSGPFDLMKTYLLNHSPEPDFAPPIPPPGIEHYSPPPIRNHFDHPPYGRPPRPYRPFRGPKGFRHPPPPQYHPSSSYDIDFHYSRPPPFDLNHEFTRPTPMIQSVDGEGPPISQLENLYRGLVMSPPGYQTNSIDEDMPNDPHDSPSYIPSTGLQAEVEHFDPFYSPLLSKIDSIFTHLGYNDEGCRERVVCSIYKFPVKYAPYSNLISAQLSKHQSELKRPVSSSTKILRYFRYMKAAKDGQGGDNCVELYPKCDSDTDSVSSLPMITTFHQLSELMTAESSQPGVALASAG